MKETWIWPQQTGEKERELVWEGACKRTTNGKTGNKRANKTIQEIQKPNENSHHVPKLLTLQGLPHMSAHPRHMWVHRDNLIDYGRILQHRRHLLEELGRVHHRLHLKCGSDQYEYKTGVERKNTIFNAPYSGHSDSTPCHQTDSTPPSHRTPYDCLIG